MAVGIRTKRWTLEELHSLPDDGNKYELVRGELFVTPAPSNVHQMVIARLNMILVPYVVRHRLGTVHQARSIVRVHGDEAEPDLFVRADAPGVVNNWEDAPAPALVVEVLSDSTRRRDMKDKRAFYLNDVQVCEYWIVDPEARSVRVIRPERADEVITGKVSWHPAGAPAALAFESGELFEVRTY